MRMVSFVSAIALASVFSVAAHADTMAHCSGAWNGMSAADKAKTTYQAWSATCLKSDYHVSAAATPASAPAGATGQCKDGTYTMSKTKQGACSNHGGLAKSL
jgi:hypothetical protein